jgi:peptidoglycan/LPS O-acetylase OafA/YrhL
MDNSANSHRLDSLESLRGLLALWVVVGHVLRRMDLSDPALKALSIFTNPSYAVDVFIMLSGFVIFFLLDSAALDYRRFIVRRFFRLFPLYFFVLLVAAFLLPWEGSVLAEYPWTSPGLRNAQLIHDATEAHFWEQFLVHLTMLHGLVPDSILPQSQYAFVGAAWSISVEWQFYLVAPWLFYMLQQRQWGRAALVLIAVCMLRAVNHHGEGLIVNQAGFFLIGIASYYLWRYLRDRPIPPSLLDFCGMLWIATVYLFSVSVWSLVIWGAVMVVIVAETTTHRSVLQTLAIRILASRPLLWLGKISYSIYLTHMLVVLLVADAMLNTVNGATFASAQAHWQFVLISLALTLAGTVLLSALTYTLIERPGMALGRKLASKQVTRQTELKSA